MQFKHPEFLYFLGFLLIPFLVHLFQLQQFKKTPFTNVSLLQKLIMETRKSSRLKKWLILSCRLLLFTGIIIAFSQPYSSTKKVGEKMHTFIYLDNSLSLYTSAKKGNLLQTAIKEIIENSSTINSYSLLTNSNFHEKISSDELKSILLNTGPTAKSRSLNSVLLKIKSSNTTKTNTLNNSIVISDFQYFTKNPKLNVTNVTHPISIIQLNTSEKNNISIDNLSTSNHGVGNYTLEISVKNQGDEKKDIPITLYNDSVVFSKQSFSISKDSLKTISFPIQNNGIFKGKISINYNDIFSFDNHHYFTINSTKKTNIFSIGKDHDFLTRIYQKNEFNFSTSSIQNINYNVLKRQDLIILNELPEIPTPLATFLETHLQQNKNLVIIPNQNINIKSYNSFFKNHTIGKVTSLKKDSLRISSINFNNPFYNHVFSKKITNFQFPIVKSHLHTNFSKATALIQFENETNFFSELDSKNGTIYWSASSLKANNSNFKNSPLIVPLFYNFGKLSRQLPKSSYIVNNLNSIDIPTQTSTNTILSVRNSITSFIPKQQAYNAKITIQTLEQPDKSGFYMVTNKNKTLQTIAFNYNTNESLLNFLQIEDLIKSNKNIHFSNSISEVFKEIKKKNEVTWLWKWFLTIAIVSLFFEILILKFFKP